MLSNRWRYGAFSLLMALTALGGAACASGSGGGSSSVPRNPNLIEAAELDNCGWGQKLVYIILPMVRATVLNLIVLSFIGKMKIFDLVWVTTQGNPLWATETVSTYVYKRAFRWSTFDLGYPSTIAVVWFVIVLAGVLLLNRLFRRQDRLEY